METRGISLSPEFPIMTSISLCMNTPTDFMEPAGRPGYWWKFPLLILKFHSDHSFFPTFNHLQNKHF